jgi:hypothetical protein
LEVERLGEIDEIQDIFLETTAAKADGGLQELISDPPV